MVASGWTIAVVTGLACLIPPRDTAPGKFAEAANRPRWELLGMNVNKPLPGMGMVPFGGGWPGTSMTFLFRGNSDREVIGVDTKASKLESFVDDQGTNLNVSDDRPFGWSRFGQFRSGQHAHSSEGRTIRCYYVQIGADGVPAPGSSKVRLKAKLALRCASSSETLEKKDIELKTGGTVKMGDVSVSIKEADPEAANPFKEAGTVVALVSDDSLERIQQANFFGPDGKSLRTAGSGSRTQSQNGRQTVTRTYALAEKVEKVSIKIVYYRKLETILVPLSVETGIGF